MTVDVSEWLKALDGMDDLKEALARRMGVSGGVIVRDAAIENAPDGDKNGPYNAEWKTGSSAKQEHVLADAMYLAYSDQSTPTKIVYSISWNAKKAFWGVFVEFGFLMDNLVIMNPDGSFFTDDSKPKPGGGLQVKARPFLAPALDANVQNVYRAAVSRGKEELPKLLREIKK